MESLGNLMVGLGADWRGMRRDLGKAGKSVRKFSSKSVSAFGRISKSVFSVKSAVVALAGTGGLGLLSRSFVDTASTMERLTIQLDAITKGKGEETFRKLNEWAMLMPVNTEKAIESFKNMKAMGLDPTIADMTILVDTVSALGAGAEGMQGIAQALGQMHTKGKVTTEELLQLAERGIPAFQILKEELGLTSEQVGEIAKQGLNTNETIQALIRGMEKRFGGAAADMMGTWDGLMMRLKSTWTEFKRRVMEVGAFEKLKNALDDFLKLLESPRGQKMMEEWIQRIGEFSIKLVDRIVSFGHKLVEVWGWVKSVMETMEGPFSKVRSAVDAVWSVFSAFGAWFVEGPWPGIVEIVRAIQSALSSMGGEFVESVWPKIVEAAHAIKNALDSMGRGFIERVWPKIVEAARAIWNAISSMGGGFADTWDTIKDSLKEWWKAVGGLYTAVMELLEAVGLFSGDSESTGKAFTLLGRIFGGLVNWMIKLSTAFIRLTTFFVNILKPIIIFVKALFITLGNVLAFLAFTVYRVIKGIIHIFNFFKGVTKTVWGFITGLFKGFIKFLVGFFGPKIKWVVDGVLKIFEFLKTNIGKIWKGITSIFSKVFTWLDDNIFSFFDGFVETIKKWMGKVVDLIKKGIKFIVSAWNKVAKWIPGMAEIAMDGLFGAWNDGFNKVEKKQRKTSKFIVDDAQKMSEKVRYIYIALVGKTQTMFSHMASVVSFGFKRAGTASVAAMIASANKIIDTFNAAMARLEKAYSVFGIEVKMMRLKRFALPKPDAPDPSSRTGGTSGDDAKEEFDAEEHFRKLQETRQMEAWAKEEAMRAEWVSAFRNNLTLIKDLQFTFYEEMVHGMEDWIRANTDASSKVLDAWMPTALLMKQTFETLRDELTDIAAETMAAMIMGWKQGEGALLKAVAKMVGGIADMWGQFYVLKGFAAIAEGGWPPNALAIRAGAKQIAAGTALKTLGAVLGGIGAGRGGGGGGGGGGSGTSRSITDVAENTTPMGDRRGRVTVDVSRLTGKRAFVEDMGELARMLLEEFNQQQGMGVDMEFVTNNY